MNPLRRQLIGTAFLIPSLDAQLLERLSNVFVEPNRRSLAYLEIQMERSWEDRNKANYPPSILMPDAVSHLQQALMLFEQPSTLRPQFLVVAGVNAILVGDSLYEMGDFQAARQMYRVAIDAAHKAEDRTLEAVAWGWRSFT